MDEVLLAHLERVRVLCRPGGPLAPDAATSTLRNRAWWVDGEVTPARRRTHGRWLDETRAQASEVRQGRRAIVLAGPPGAGKSTVLAGLLGQARSQYLIVDADEFKRLMLRDAIADGSYQGWIVPPEVKALQAAGEQFFPLELAALVHRESVRLAQQLRRQAISRGDDVVIDTVLGDQRDALALGAQLEEAKYRVQVIDVEVPRDVSNERIRARWVQSYEAALAGGDPLGGRWVPSDYTRGVFDGPDGRSKPEAAARALAEQCPAVTDYQLFRTTGQQIRDATAAERAAQPVLDVDRARYAPGAALLERSLSAMQGRAALARPRPHDRSDRGDSGR